MSVHIFFKTVLQGFEEFLTLLEALQAAGIGGGGKVTVVAGPDEYLFGEEKAMLEVVEGKPPLPRLLPPYVHGLFATAPQSGWEGTRVSVLTSADAIARRTEPGPRAMATAASVLPVESRVMAVSCRGERRGKSFALCCAIALPRFPPSTLPSRTPKMLPMLLRRAAASRCCACRAATNCPVARCATPRGPR